MKMEIKVPPPLGYPLFGWTEDLVKKYVIEKPLKTGDEMIIYSGQAGMHHYILARVENPALGKQKRIVLNKSGGWGGVTFYQSGKNCFAPKGQTRMLPPIAEIFEYVASDIDVWLDIPPYC